MYFTNVSQSTWFLSEDVACTLPSLDILLFRGLCGKFNEISQVKINIENIFWEPATKNIKNKSRNEQGDTPPP